MGILDGKGREGQMDEGGRRKKKKWAKCRPPGRLEIWFSWLRCRKVHPPPQGLLCGILSYGCDLL